MARIVWDRIDNIKDAKKTIPFKPRASREDFRPPSTIETDFQRLLKHDVPHVNWTFELIHDWYYAIMLKPRDLIEKPVYYFMDLYKNGTRFLRIHLTAEEAGEDIDEGTGIHIDKDGSVTMIYALSADGTFALSDDFTPEYIRGQQTSID